MSLLRFELARAEQTEKVATIIRESFRAQVDLLGITREEYPNYVGFETAKGVEARMNRGSSVILAYFEGMSVGTVSYGLDGNQIEVGYIERMAVLPAFRGRKFGQLLLEYAEGQLQKQGVTSVELSIVAQFTALQRFYEQAGYIPKNRIKPANLPFEVLFLEKSLR